MTSTWDILGIGNAIVDVIAHADDDFLQREKIQKGGMTLIAEARAVGRFERIGPVTTMSGGSGANTIVGAASFGVKSAYIGKVRDDDTGKIFAHDIGATGVHFPTSRAEEGPATARCIVLVTPDGERTMSTYLGACQHLTEADVDESVVQASAFTYLEGYLWDPPAAKKAFLKASRVAHAAGRKVALTLSDSFCVDRYRDEFLKLIQDGSVDIVFANQHELKSLYQTSDLASALSALQGERVLGIITCSAEGSMVVSASKIEKAPAHPIKELVDTTGAGDLFAAGFLAGLARGKDHMTCARLGALAAAEVIQHVGARPLVSLRQLAIDNGVAI